MSVAVFEHLQVWLTGQALNTMVNTTVLPTHTSAASTSRFMEASAPLLTTRASATPRPYPAGLTPLVSPLSPHCLARDQLRFWVPMAKCSHIDSTDTPIPISDEDLDRILAVISHSHAVGTRETYGSGLLVYHVFCDT
jgi:hypothetical protein